MEFRQETNEIETHFNMRKLVFERARPVVGDDRAESLASVFRACYFWGSGYNEDVIKQSQEYWEPEWIKHYE